MSVGSSFSERSSACAGGLDHSATAGAVGAVWTNARQLAVRKAPLNYALVMGAGSLLLLAGGVLAVLLT